MMTLCRLVLIILVACFVTNGQEVQKRLSEQATETSKLSDEALGAEIAPNATRNLLDEANQFSTVEVTSEKLNAYSRAAELDPSSFEPKYKLGFAYVRTGQFRQAIPPLQDATRLAANSVKAWNLLGVAHYRLGEFDQAANCFRRASQVDPNHPAPFNNLGHSFLQMERYSAAQRAFSRALQIDSNFGRSVTGLCIAMAHVGPGSEQGASLCRKAVILDPTSSSANYLVGYELLNRAQYREALPYFRRAVELEPSTGLNYLALGRALYGIGELDEAFKNLSRAAELQPGLAEAYTAKGAVHFRKRRFKEAIEEFKHAIELDPDSVAARYNLGVVCFAKGDRDCALQQYNRLKILTSPMGDKLLKLIFRNRIIDARSYPGSKSND